MTIRIYADFNSRDVDGWCWCLRYGEHKRPLESVADSLGFIEGQPVILYYEDVSEEFEFDAVLSLHQGGWQALPDETTYRLIRSQISAQTI